MRGPIEGSPRATDVYRVGTVLRVVKMLKFPDDSYRLLVQGVARARVEEFVAEAPFLRGAHLACSRTTGDPSSVETAALSRNVRDSSSRSSRRARVSPTSSRCSRRTSRSPSRLADLVASNLELDVAAQAGACSRRSTSRRACGACSREVRRAREALKVESEIREKVQSEMGKTQREYMLRQQLDEIRKELGEAEDAEDEVEALRERIEAAGLPEEALKQAHARARAARADAARPRPSTA